MQDRILVGTCDPYWEEDKDGVSTDSENDPAARCTPLLPRFALSSPEWGPKANTSRKRTSDDKARRGIGRGAQ